MDEQQKNRLMMFAGVGSVTTTVALIILKIGAFIGTGSVAILSSLFDSVQDFMTSLINMIAVHQAIQPADKAHRFGHGKAQGIGCLLQAFIIAISSVMLLIESVMHLWRSEPVDHIGLGVWVILIAIVLTFILVSFQKYVVRETGSLSIKADRAHYAGDVFMNVGVLCSLFAAGFLGWLWVDGLFGIVVSGYLFYTVWQVMQEACAMLMDRELPPEVRKKVREIVLSVPSVKDVFDIRTREGGNKQFVQFTVQFDGRVSLKKAHADLDLIEHLLHNHYPDMEVIIHAEPYKKKKKNQNEKIVKEQREEMKISRLDENRLKRQKAKEDGNTAALFGLAALGCVLFAGHVVVTQMTNAHRSMKSVLKSLSDTGKKAIKSIKRDEVQQVLEAVDNATDTEEQARLKKMQEDARSYE